MTETVVHVETLKQWKSVLDVWFEQGYDWIFKTQEYFEYSFEQGSRFLVLKDNKIWHSQTSQDVDVIEYADFMKQQEETMTKETYYVTQEQLDLIERAKIMSYTLTAITSRANLQKEFYAMTFRGIELQNAILRYLGGDISIEFKVKEEQLYRLWRIDDDKNRVYMIINNLGNPTWILDSEFAFTAPREEIEKWKTPAWDIEKVD